MIQKLIFTIAFTIMLTWMPVSTKAVGERGTGLPLPRFVSLKDSPVNMRTGPGFRYPVKWKYAKAGVPVKIILEMNNWRKVRDWEGTEGWIHRNMLSGRRTIRVMGIERILRNMGSVKAAPVARIEPGVFGQVLECPRSLDFCRVEIEGYTGWLKRNEFWGIDPGEHLER